jgi:hypothetical protein
MLGSFLPPAPTPNLDFSSCSKTQAVVSLLGKARSWVQTPVLLPLLLKQKKKKVITAKGSHSKIWKVTFLAEGSF